MVLSKWSPPFLKDLLLLHQVFLAEFRMGSLGQLALPLALSMVARIHLHHHFLSQQHVPFLVHLEWLEPYVSLVSAVVVEMAHLE